MKTFIAVCNFDRRWYARRSIVLTATVGLCVLMGILILLKHPLKSVSPLLAAVALVQDALMIAAPFIFIRYAADLGRSATPFRPRAFVHALPVDHQELAMAKLFHGFIWLVTVPLLGIAGVLFALTLFKPGWLESLPLQAILRRPGFWLGLPLWVLVSMAWTMLLSALLSGRWLVIGAPLLIIGEAVSRNITTGDSLLVYLAALRDHPRPPLSVGIDLGLLALMALLLAGIFVHYHVRRNRTWSLAGAVLVLAVIDGLRALVCWQTTLTS